MNQGLRVELLILLILSQLSITSADQAVGFLRIYNCMSDSESLFTPNLNSKPLTKTPLKLGESLPESYFEATTHQLQLESTQFKHTPVDVLIQKDLTLTVVVYDKLKKGRPTLLALRDPAKPNQEHPTLRVVSLNEDNHNVKIGSHSITLPAFGDTLYESWNGKSFQLRIDQKEPTAIQIQDEATPHTLVIWGTEVILISHKKLSPPKALRKDLSFGPKREEFKNLRKMVPRKPTQ